MQSSGSRRFDLKSSDTPPLILCAGVLLVCIFYAYLYVNRPNLGFLMNPGDWVVTSVTVPCEDPDHCFQVGDRVISVGEISHEDFRANSSLSIYSQFRTGGPPVPVIVGRGTETLMIEVEAMEGLRKEPIHNFLAAFFPCVFWLMGAIATIFVRPRDERWLVLVLFLYATAMWSAAGFVSSTQMGYSSVVLRLCLLLSMPLLVHLHLVLPEPLFRRFHRPLLIPFYALSLALALLTFLRESQSMIFVCTLGATLSSAFILVLRLFLPSDPATRVANRLLAFGVSLGLGPTIIATVIILFFPKASLPEAYTAMVAAIASIVVPMWPVTYIYAIYKHDLGSFSVRANRILGAYGFLSIYITLYLAMHVVMTRLRVGDWEHSNQAFVVMNLMISVVFVASAPLARERFQRLIDRHVFGLKYTPNEVISKFAEKIPGAFNRDVLRRIILREVLPTLLVRQSALYVFRDEELETILVHGVDPGNPTREELTALLLRAGQYIPLEENRDSSLPWVRLTAPLSIGDRTIGIWLFGRRDPDDYYPTTDSQLLSNLANQIAPVLEHVQLVETAQQEIAENKKLQSQLVHSQKMEAIGRLSAGVAHDFNNLLSVILGYSDLLLVRYPDNSTISRYLSDIRDAGQRAANLTKQLLAFSRQQLMETKVLDLNQVIDGVTSLVERIVNEDVEVVTTLSDTSDLVKVDPGQIEQVILNLAVNASDAMPSGGQLAIETRRTCQPNPDPGGDASHPDLPAGSYVQLRVTDTGSGMDPEVQAHVFEPFFTTKEVGKGTGLGLSMVYGIINQSSGHIFVDSELGKGTTFSIYLPVVQEEATKVAPEHQNRFPRPIGSETILVVEDEEIVRKVACEILQAEGYHVLRAQDGAEALDVSQQHAGPISLLLTDVVMPLIKGPELARRLSRARPGIKVLFMSGYSEESIPELSSGDGMHLLIKKPFPPRALSQQVREILDGMEAQSA